MPALEAYLVLPWTIEIVLVAEAGTNTEAKLGERDRCATCGSSTGTAGRTATTP